MDSFFSIIANYILPALFFVVFIRWLRSFGVGPSGPTQSGSGVAGASGVDNTAIAENIQTIATSEHHAGGGSVGE